MWRPRGASGVELRLIDFEDAVLFGHVIPIQLINHVVENWDWRYPFKDGDEKVVQLAKPIHNNFFVEAVRQWVDDDDHDDFDDFMRLRGPIILLDLSKEDMSTTALSCDLFDVNTETQGPAPLSYPEPQVTSSSSSFMVTAPRGKKRNFETSSTGRSEKIQKQ